MIAPDAYLVLAEKLVTATRHLRLARLPSSMISLTQSGLDRGLTLAHRVAISDNAPLPLSSVWRKSYHLR